MFGVPMGPLTGNSSFTLNLLGPRCKSTKTREQNCKDAMAKMQKAKVLSSEGKGAILHNFELLPLQLNLHFRLLFPLE